ncbi:hypothetical protein AB0P07_08330 [Streptomyces sp. NPDC085944]|uniref:hypothetical protein n=1 Tax=Streptomyces sp. NPDC085944 TaxID=3154962 RepID=UPI003431F36C
MARQLNTFVHVGGVWYGPDSKVPARVAEKIGDHAWESADSHAEPDAPKTPAAPVEAPPRSGRGSGIDAWRAYAEANGYDTDDEMSRDDVIALLEREGVIEPEQPKE